MKIFLAEIGGYRTGTGAVTWRVGSTDFDNGGTFYPGRIINAATFRRDVGILEPRSQASLGEAVLNNEDGYFNGMADDFFDGRTFTLKMGDEGAAYASFVTILVATIESVAIEASVVSVRLRDRAITLDQPFSRDVYAGTNSLPLGLEGTADDIKGQYKPRIFGRVSLMRPVLVNTSKLIYQVSTKACVSVTQVFGGGAYIGKTPDILSGGKTATASSYFGSGLEPSKAFDGSDTTRWASASGAYPHQLKVDLGSSVAITRVRIYWDASYATSYEILTSPDGVTWTNVFARTGATGGVEDCVISSSGRYILLRSLAGVNTLVSVKEMQVFGVSNSWGLTAYMSQSDMENNQPSPGYFRPWSTSAGTYFRLGSTPFGDLACSVAESWTPTQISAAGITLRVLQELGYTASDYVAADFTALDQACCGPLGIVVDPGETTANLLDRIFSTVGGWWGFDSTGRFRCGRLDDPAGLSPVMTIDDTIIREIEREPGANAVWTLSVGGDRNYAPQQKSSLAGVAAADSGRTAWLEAESRKQVATDTSVLTSRFLCEKKEVESLFTSISQAAAEANRRLGLLKARRDVVNLTVNGHDALPGVDIGSVVTVQTDRLGYSSGRKMIVTGIGIDYQANQIDLKLWG